MRAKFGACSVQNAQLLFRTQCHSPEEVGQLSRDIFRPMILPQNNYIQKGITRRIVSHASLRMLNFLASVMREFYEEIDRKNRIFGRKTDILRKCVARCAILLNIYGKKDCFDVSSYNWAHKHHFIVRKTKKTYLSDCENSHEKQQTGIFCELKTCFYLPISG